MIALFDNFDRTLELIELSHNSAGEAAIQHDEYMQGLEATTTRLQTSFQELITSFVSSDLIIGALNAFNTAIELLNTRVGRLLITLGSVALAIGAVKNATTGALGAVSAFFMGQIDEETQIRAPISMFKTLTTSLVKEGDFKTFRANAAKAFEGFKASAQGATNYLKQGFIPAIKSAASFIGIAFTNAHHSVSLFAKATKDTLVNLAGSFKSIVLDRLTIVSRQYLSTLQGTLLAASKQMGQSMQNLRINIPKLDPLSIQQTFKAAFDPMTPYFSTLRTVFSTFYKTITEGAIKAFTTIKSGFINLGPSIKDTIAGFKAYRKQIAAIQNASFDLSDPVKNIALQKKAINDLAQQSRFAGNSLVGMSNKTGNVFLKLGPMLVAPFKMLASFLLSPAGIVLVIIGLIVAFKKIREATDTTNPTIARLKVAFDRVARGVNNFVKAIADFLVPLLKSLWPAIKVLLGPMGMLIGLFTNLNEAEEAAASLRVLTNEYKAMNKEVRETEKQLLKLNKTLKDFTDLNRATFKSSAQMEQLEEVRQQIKDILEEAGVATMGLTTAQLEDELTIMIQEQEKEVKRQYDIMGRKIKQFFAENPLLNFEDALLDPAFDEELKDSLGVFAQEYAKMVIDGFDGMAPEVQAAILRMVRVDPAQFLDQTKEVQKAFRSTIAVLGNRNDFLPGVSKVFQIIEGETMEEAFERFSKTLIGGVLIRNLGYTFADFAEQVEDSFATVNSEVSELYTTTIPEVTKALELIQSPQFDNDFVKGLAQLQEIDLSKLNADELDSLFQAFPNLESILNLPAAQDALGEYTEAVLRLQERGGVAFLRQFDGIRRAVDNLKIEENLESSTVTQTRRVNIEVDDSYWKKGFVMAAGQSLEQAFNDFLAENPGSKITFEEFAEQVKDNITTTMTGVFNADTADQIQGYLLDSFTSSKDLYATASALGEEIARGSIDGVELGFEEQQELLSSIFNFLDSKTIEEITQSTYAFLDDIRKLGEIAQKRGSYTADDLNLLRKYPGVMQQIAAGEFDILAFKEEQLENTKNTIVAEKNRSVVALSTQAHLLNMQLLSNKLTEEQRKSTQAQLDALKGQIAETAAYYDLLLDVVEASDDDAFLNSQKELLNIQKQSIERARQLRDLQKEAAESVSKAIQATRVGAVGTIEAQFNQAQLNKEIAEANRRLEEEIILAQIEAQQKILEDSQQKAILEATGDNTTATNTNSDRLRVLTDAVNKILGPSGRRQILSTNSGSGDGGSLGILNDVVSIQG